MTSDGKDGYFSVPSEYHMIYNPPRNPTLPVIRWHGY